MAHQQLDAKIKEHEDKILAYIDEVFLLDATAKSNALKTITNHIHEIDLYKSIKQLLVAKEIDD